MRKAITAGVVAASMLGGAAAGIALYTPGSAGAQTGKSVQVGALSATDPSTQTTPATAPQWMTDALKKLVTDGKITQAQADEVAGALAAAAPRRGSRGPGFGHGPHEMGADLAIAAKAIGISETDLQTALQSGQSLAAVAKAHNVDPQKVIDALVADEEAELADQVKNGALTQAQADQMKSGITQRVTDRVNGTGGPHGPGGRHGGPMMVGPGAGQDQQPGGTSGSSGSSGSGSVTG